MKKHNTRKRIARIFRRYVRLGLGRGGLTPHEVCGRIWGYCGDVETAKDVFAMWETFRVLEIEGRRDAIVAFFCIYVRRDAWRDDTDTKILKYSFDNFCDARTVYRRLSYFENKYTALRKSLDY